ncbi:protein adenylyltransferase SelO [Planktotalea sp.]|uniref:protein adenylyltransferase SelO n=1 Tax=Planktotalea sp. TaxID=2029877 RepID=UPI0025F7AA56|nr:YdiU family protein [Planktotalea sp.]
MKTSIPFDNSLATLGDAFFTRQAPEPAPAPELIAYNDVLGDDLGITKGSDDDLAAVFSGTANPAGADPLAQLYAGHQFGTYNPQLGDGRAVLLGEVIDRDGQRRDIQLKGSGRTPYSRGGDGKAWLGPVLREYVVSEAMHALGIPTTRALAAVSTGEQVYRETQLPGAIVTRVAASHIRVGTFQVFAARQEYDNLRILTDYTIKRHCPDADGTKGLLQSAMDAQTKLIPVWMGVGFIHGVMNTDNCQIAGETIDYGPCAFMDAFASDRVFSSIDRGARYSYANQPDIAIWNMAQLATSLVPLMPDKEQAIEEFTAMLHVMKDALRGEWLSVFAAKLGITELRHDDGDLIAELLEMMENGGSDFTNTFSALSDGSAIDHITDRTTYRRWHDKWQSRIQDENDPQTRMASKNPTIIPRNHQIEAMIQSAVAGDFAPFHRLNAALLTPFGDNAENADLKRPPTQQEIVPATFCGT